MDTLIHSALADIGVVDTFLYNDDHNRCRLTELDSSALEQVLAHTPPHSSEEDFAMSPDSNASSDTWQQPDSTSSNAVAYDSDAFNSDDSNQSFTELEMNPNLISNLVAQAAQATQAQVVPGSPATSEASVNHFVTKKKKKKSKRGGDVILKCEQCSYQTRFKEHLNSHMNTHKTDRKYMCSDCGMTFKWSHSLNRHQKTHRADNKSYACSVCLKAFSRKDHLNTHENLHRAAAGSENAFPCPDCNASFKNKKTLLGHLKTHSAEKEFPCDQCESRFTRRASLNRHVKAAHAGETISCPLCPASFSYRSTLEDHKRAAHNEGRRDFECGLCGVQFAVKAYLTKHMVTCRNRAHGKSFPCEVCPKTFPTKRHLTEHSKRKHACPEIIRPQQQQMQTLEHVHPHVPQQPQPQQQQPLPPMSLAQYDSSPLPPYPGSNNSAYVNPPESYPSHYQQQQPAPYCHPAFDQHHVDYHTAATVDNQGGNDLMQPQQQPHEETVGSLLRLVYSCSDSEPQQQQAPQHAYYSPRPPMGSNYAVIASNDKVQTESLLEPSAYSILEDLPSIHISI